jgi:hypothetical protein
LFFCFVFCFAFCFCVFCSKEGQWRK